MVFANGRIPVSVLVQAANGAPGQVLEAQTALQWAAMVHAAGVAGVRLAPEPDGGVASCYRSYDNQVYAKQVQAQGGPTAATPGASNHGLGTAIDIDITSSVMAWLNAHAGEYGFDNVQGQATVPAENWHWVRTRTVAGITNTITENIMATGLTILSNNNGQGPRYLICGPGTYIPVGDSDGVGGQETLDAFKTLGATELAVDTRTFDVLNIRFKRYIGDK